MTAPEPTPSPAAARPAGPRHTHRGGRGTPPRENKRTSASAGRRCARPRRSLPARGASRDRDRRRLVRDRAGGAAVPGGLRTTLQTRTPEQAEALGVERENRAYLPGVELPAQLRVEPVSAGVARADYVFLAVPSRGLARRDSRAALGRARAAHRRRIGRQGARPARRAAADDGAERALRPAPRRLRRRPRPRAGDGALRRRFGGGLRRRGARAFARADVHARRSGVRAVQRPDRRGAGGRRQERRRAGVRRHRGAGPERRRAPPPGTSSPRCGATRRAWGRGPSR